MGPRYHIGTSGWHYDHWIDHFYPKGLAKRKWLEFYAGEFDTVEINGSFYRLPSEKTARTWRDTVPTGFLFAVKASRYITHYRKLQDVAEPLDLFISRARLLGDKLGPILFQLPPNLKRDDEVLAAFFALLPKDLRYSVEFRHSSWFAPEVFRLLEQHGVALCTIDLAGFECPLLSTANFVYHRFHGYDDKLAGYYPDEELESWAGRIEDFARGKVDAFVFFNNDALAAAVDNARKLAKLLNRPDSRELTVPFGRR